MVYEMLKEEVCSYFELDEDYVTRESVLLGDICDGEPDLYDLVMTVEDMFNKEVSDEALENIHTLGDLVNFLENK